MHAQVKSKLRNQASNHFVTFCQYISQDSVQCKNSARGRVVKASSWKTCRYSGNVHHADTIGHGRNCELCCNMFNQEGLIKINYRNTLQERRYLKQLNRPYTIDYVPKFPIYRMASRRQFAMLRNNRFRTVIWLAISPTDIVSYWKKLKSEIYIAAFTALNKAALQGCRCIGKNDR